jgi:hypothetical protein
MENKFIVLAHVFLVSFLRLVILVLCVLGFEISVVRTPLFSNKICFDMHSEFNCVAYFFFFFRIKPTVVVIVAIINELQERL